MPYFIDLERMEVVVRPAGSTAAAGQVVIDSETAAACELTDGMRLTADQVESLRGGSSASYRATVGARHWPTSDRPDLATPPQKPSTAAPVATFRLPASGSDQQTTRVKQNQELKVAARALDSLSWVVGTVLTIIGGVGVIMGLIIALDSDTAA